MAIIDFEKYRRGSCQADERRHMIYDAWLEMNPVRPRLMRQLLQYWETSAETIARLQIAALPTPIGAVVRMDMLQKAYGSLQDIPGFVWTGECWMPDLNPEFLDRSAEVGFFQPFRNKRGMIEHLQVFRYAKDPKPFKFQTRSNSPLIQTSYAAA